MSENTTRFLRSISDQWTGQLVPSSPPLPVSVESELSISKDFATYAYVYKSAVLLSQNYVVSERDHHNSHRPPDEIRRVIRARFARTVYSEIETGLRDLLLDLYECRVMAGDSGDRAYRKAVSLLELIRP